MKSRGYTYFEKEAMKKIVLLLSDIQINIILTIMNNTYQRCQIKNISKEIDIPYMTIRRNIELLCEIQLLRKIDYDYKRPCYYGLTEFGNEFAKIIEREKKE